MPTTTSLTASGDEPRHVLVNNFLHCLQGAIGTHGLPEPTEEMKRCIVRIGEALLPLDIPAFPRPQAALTTTREKSRNSRNRPRSERRLQPGNQPNRALALSILQVPEGLPYPARAPALDARPLEAILPVGPTIVQMMMPFCKAAGADTLFKTVRARYQQGAAHRARSNTRAKAWVWPEITTGRTSLTPLPPARVSGALRLPVPYGFTKDERRFVGISGSWPPRLRQDNAPIGLHTKPTSSAWRATNAPLVMDSQNRIVPGHRPAKCFAPGQPMHDRLIYIEPSVNYPAGPQHIRPQIEAVLGAERGQPVRASICRRMEMIEDFLFVVDAQPIAHRQAETFLPVSSSKRSPDSQRHDIHPGKLLTERRLRTLQA